MAIVIGGQSFLAQTQKPATLTQTNTVNYSSLTVTSSPNVELVLIDPSGKRTGCDPRLRRSYREIVESDYGSEIIPGSSGKEIKLLSINMPQPGQYILRVTGVVVGNYTLTVEGNSANSKHQTEITLSAKAIGRNEVHIYQFSYNQGLASNPKPVLISVQKP